MKLRRVARIISVVFDPVIVLGLIGAWIGWSAFKGGYPMVDLAIMGVIDGVLPILVYAIFMRQKHWRDWEIHKREQRLPIYVAVVGCQALGVIVAAGLNLHPLTEWLMCFWLLVAVFAVVTLFWKISVHTGALATLVTLLTLDRGGGWSWLWLLVLLVGWARVVDRDHTWAQVVVGALVPWGLISVVLSNGG